MPGNSRKYPSVLIVHFFSLIIAAVPAISGESASTSGSGGTVWGV
jgi:hypothetical protein